MLPGTDIWQKLIEQGDEKAFESLFHTYFAKLCSFARDYVIDKEASREIVQDTFLKLWEIRESLGADTNIRSLLYTITRNNALNYLKHELVVNKHKNRQGLHSSLELNYIALNDMPVQKFIAEDLNLQLKKIIAGLPEKCRTAFVMSRNLNLSYREIANSMGISVNTVENHISEALKKIRNELKS